MTESSEKDAYQRMLEQYYNLTPEEWNLRNQTAPQNLRLVESNKPTVAGGTISSPHPIEEVFSTCVRQLASGKGQQRHGHNNKSFYDQQWVEVTRRHGLGFLTGQAVKKANEAALNLDNLDKEAGWWEREMIGAINYLAMAILYRRLLNGNS